MRARSPLKPLILLALCAGAAWAAWHLLSAGGAEVKARPPASVSVVNAAREDVPLLLYSVGNVVPYETVAVKARLDSQVVSVKFRDGDVVKAGDVLFELDSRALTAQAAQAEANLARDRAQAENLRQQYTRGQALAEKGFQSKEQLENAKAAYVAAQASANATRASLENIKVMLHYTRITAPISGRAGTINVTVGNTVRAGDAQPMVTINQMQPIRAQGTLPQVHLGALRAALARGPVAVVATPSGASAKAEGLLEYIDNTVDASSGAFIFRANFENADEALWPGMFVNLSVDLGVEASALTIPEVAVQRGQEGDFAFVVVEGKALKRAIRVQRITGGKAVVESGLEAGDAVVTDGLMNLTDGASVNVAAAAP